jgi:predicted XRE-type DNA-binding protein
MNYSNDEILKRIEEAKRDNAKLTHITSKSALSTEDKFKIGLCKHFVQFLNEEKMRLTELSDLTDIPKTRLSEITNYKINKFKVDQLLKYLSILADHSPRVKEYLNFLEQAIEVPALKVSETKKLTRGLKEVIQMGGESPRLLAW